MKLKQFLCWLLGHKWRETDCPADIDGRYVCRRCRAIRYRSK